MPGTPTTYAPPAPPTAANASAVMAAADARQRAGAKKGLNSTVLNTPPGANTDQPVNMFAPMTGQKNTLLGGG